PRKSETARASPSAARRVAIRARAARSPSWPSSTAAAVRARRSSASAAAAWMPNRPSRSTSSTRKRASAGRSSTSSTPRASSPCRSGTAMIPFGTNPVDWAVSAEKRGSVATSARTSGWRVPSTQPAMPVPEGKRRPTRVSSPSPTTASKTSSSVASSSSSTLAARAWKIARATSTIDPSRARWARSSASTPAATASRRRRSSAIGRLRVRGGEPEQGLHLGRGEVGVLGPDERAHAGDVRRREAVPGGAHAQASHPGDAHVHPAGEELHGRVGIAEIGERVVELVARDRDHRREPPRVARDRHVVGRGDDDAALEVGGVGEVVQHLDEPALRGREAHVDDVVALLDRPAQALDEHGAAAHEALAEDADAGELALRRDLADDPGAGGAVAAHVAEGVRLDHDLIVLDRDDDRRVDPADARVTGLDAAVDDAHTGAAPGRVAQRPLARDPGRPRPGAGQRLHGGAVDCVCREILGGVGHRPAMLPTAPGWPRRGAAEAGGATKGPRACYSLWRCASTSGVSSSLPSSFSASSGCSLWRCASTSGSSFIFARSRSSPTVDLLLRLGTFLLPDGAGVEDLPTPAAI